MVETSSRLTQSTFQPMDKLSTPLVRSPQMKISTVQPSTWIFQANPKLYDIQASLRKEQYELWGCKQHVEKIKKGDRALIWISGPKAGIYAVGNILTNPSPQPDTPKGMDYWKNKLDGLDRRHRVWIQYEQVLIEHPLLREYLRCDPGLWDMKILKQPLGTNFSVTQDEWEAIKIWLEE